MALQHVGELPAVAVVEQKFLDGAASAHFGLHPGIDSVKYPRNPDEQGWLHLSCTDRKPWSGMDQQSRAAQLWLGVLSKSERAAGVSGAKAGGEGRGGK